RLTHSTRGAPRTTSGRRSLPDVHADPPVRWAGTCRSRSTARAQAPATTAAGTIPTQMIAININTRMVSAASAALTYASVIGRCVLSFEHYRRGIGQMSGGHGEQPP